MARRLVSGRPLALAGGLLLAAGRAGAQPDPEVVDPAAIQRVADQLRALKGLSPELLDQVRRLRQENPGANFDELARRLADRQPDLRNPERQAQLRRLVEQFGGQGLGDRRRPGEFRPRPTPTPGPAQGGPENPPPAVNPGRQVTPPDAGPGRQAGGPQVRGLDRPVDAPQAREPLPRFDADPRAGQRLAAVHNWWEKNVGPLDKTPAVRDLLKEILTGQGAGADSGALGDLFGKDGESRSALGKLFDGTLDGEPGGDLKLPEVRLGGLKLGGWGGPAAPGGLTAPGGGFSAGGGSWLPVVLFGLVAAGGLVLWWLWPRLTAGRDAGPRPLPGLGPWPVDPRTINDRDALVKAFEYLSLLACGPRARTWNHMTIAAALGRAVPGADARAEPLARLYEAARYTPADEPLPAGVFAAARAHLSALAGVRPA